MALITDLYKQLFGRESVKDGDVISFAEHGRSGGVDSGQGFKFTKPVDEKILIDEIDASTSYFGFANPDTLTSEASWAIMKKTVSGTVTTYAWADGDTDYNNIWDNRTSLSYS